MTKVVIFSGFLGAGKTTLIKKLLSDAWKNEKVVLIENEFGEIGIDGGFMKDAGIEVTEMNSGCICCSLVGDFGAALKKVVTEYAPDRILIEPSGVGKLSDVVLAVEAVDAELAITATVAVVDATKCKMYVKNFGEFYNNQIESARSIVLSRTQNMSDEKLAACEALLREHNATAPIVTTPWETLDAATLLNAIEPQQSLEELLLAQHAEAAAHAAAEEGHEHHHHHEDGEECHCHDHEHEHHHADGEECHCHDHEHEHHHHEDGEECHCHDHEHEHHHADGEECHCHDHEHEHEHHHEDGEECHCHDHEHEHHHADGETCSCGHHHHHHGHDADEVFTSWGHEGAKEYSEEALGKILTKLDSGDYGIVLRAKGIIPCTDGTWLHFDYVPEEHEIRHGCADYTGRLCVIGSQLKENELATLFGVE